MIDAPRHAIASCAKTPRRSTREVGKSRVGKTSVPTTLVLAPDASEIYRVEGEADILALRRRILGSLPDAGLFAGNTEYWRH